MSKSTIVRTWFGGLIGLGAGLLLAGFCIAIMLAYGGTFRPAATGNGYDYVPNLDGVFWLTVSGIVLGGVVVMVAGLVQLVAWIGALINTYPLADKAWFAVLLIGGLLGIFFFGLIGLIAMAAYVIAGPDSGAIPIQGRVQTSTPNTLAPTA